MGGFTSLKKLVEGGLLGAGWRAVNLLGKAAK